MNANAYASYQEMFQKEKLDGVSICTVPSTHRDIVLGRFGCRDKCLV